MIRKRLGACVAVTGALFIVGSGLQACGSDDSSSGGGKGGSGATDGSSGGSAGATSECGNNAIEGGRWWKLKSSSFVNGSSSST